MATSTDTIIVRFMADSKDFTAKMNQINNASKRTTAAVREAGMAVGRSGRQSAMVFQQVGAQVGDFAIQVQGGTNAFRAFSQQAAQLAYFIPGLGGAIALAGSILIGFGANLFKAGDGAKVAQENIEAYGRAVAEFRSAVEAATASVEDLTERFGVNVDAARGLLRVQAEIKQAAAENSLTGAVEGLGAEYERIEEALASYTEKAVAAQTALNQGFATQSEALARTELAMENLGAATGMTLDEAVRFSAIWAKIQQDINTGGIDRTTANAAREMLALAQNTRDTNKEFVAGIDNMVNLVLEVLEAEAAMSRLANNTATLQGALQGAVGWAASLAQNLQAAAAAQIAAGSGLGMPSEPPGPGEGGPDAARGFVREKYGQPVVPTFTLSARPTGGGSAGGGGGASETDKFAEELAKAQEELTKFMESFDNLSENINVQFGEMMPGAVDSFVDTLFSAEKDFAAFARSLLIDMGKIIAKQLLMNQLMELFGGTPGSPVGGFQTGLQSALGVPQLPTQAFAKGGVVDGPTTFPMSRGVGLAGEAGPEAIVPLTRTRGGELGVRAATPQVVVNNFSGTEVQVSQSEAVIEIAVGRAREAVQADFNRSVTMGQGGYSRALERGYSTRRKLA